MFKGLFHSDKKKRVLSILVLVALVTSIVGVDLMMDKGEGHKIYASEFRDGFSLVPTHIDSTGLYTDSSFILSSENDDLTVESIEENFGVLGGIGFTVISEDEGYSISLDEMLNENSIYTLSYKEVSWTYQTRASFELLGALPANESTYVPVNTGIELYFSHEGVNIEDYFEISPKVSGRFESHGKVVVFVPNKLEAETVYTVTINEGVTLSDSEQVLDEAYSFEFETSPDENNYSYEGYFNFGDILYEFTSLENPLVQYMLYPEDSSKDNVIDTVVYQYKEDSTFTDDLQSLLRLPAWRSSINETNIDIKDLDKVIDFETIYNDEQYLEIPVNLESGYYLVDSTWNEMNRQVLIQVADFTVTLAETTTDDVLWVNDVTTGKPAEGVEISYDEKTLGITDEDGVAIVDMKASEEGYDLYKIRLNEQSLYYISYSSYFYEQNSYWNYFESDRNLYKPDDEIYFWGFLRNRYSEDEIENITVEISENSWWWFFERFPFMNDEIPYETTDIEVNDGIYSGSIQLPNLAPDSYQIKVKLGDEVISTQYIEVDNYVKPDYKITLEKDKNAIFLGEEIKFIINTEFYEGTPVSNIPLNINVGGTNYERTTVESNINGEYVYTYKPASKPSYYIEEERGYFNVSASLPESGEIYAYEDFRIFINDVHLDVDTIVEDEIGTIDFQLNNITLDRLNAEKNSDEYNWEKYNDYIGTPVDNQEIGVTIYKNVWVKTETGTEYDFINKEVKTRYRYDLETEVYDEVEVVTDENGYSSYSLELPTIESGYYSLVAKTNDKNDNNVEVKSGFYKNYDSRPSNYDHYVLETDKEEYIIDEEVKLQINNTNENGNQVNGYFLFIASQNGLLDVKVTNEPELIMNFKENYVPNVYVNSVWFDGEKLSSINATNIRFDYDVNNIVIEAITDKTEYMPGDECVIDIVAKYYNESTDEWLPVKGGVVNISIVDEALFSLSEYEVDILSQLYGNVSDGIYAIYNSHIGSNNWMYRGFGGEVMEMATMDSAAVEFNGGEMAKNESAEFDGATIRSEFKDTSEFTTITLDENGQGNHSFTLPDNITSWRMVLSAISKELNAGGNTSNLIVTLPYFINTNMNQTYLVGDKPNIGISSYGDSLDEGEAITYRVSCEEIGFDMLAYGEAFERVNVPLWELEEGSYTVIVQGFAESGYNDGIEMVVNVVESYHQIETLEYYDAVEGLTLDNEAEGMIDIIFSDAGKGKFIKDLYRLVYRSGKRVDQKYVSFVAKTILEEDFSVDVYNDDEVNVFDYMENGLLSILPYSEGDLETTVKMLPIIKNRVNTAKIQIALESYLYEEDASNTALALYGLAVLDQPVLVELENLLRVENLSFKDKIFVALSYAYLGDDYISNKIYEEEIAPYINNFEGISVVEYGKSNDDYLYYTSLVSLLASELDLVNKNNLFEYVTENMASKEVLVNPEILTFIENEIGLLIESNDVSVKYQYNGESYEIVLENGWSRSITLPAAKLDTFVIEEVNGDADIITSALKPIAKEITLDDDVEVEKQITAYNETRKALKEGDIVKVTINYDISETAIDDVYQIIDYAPSGLVPLTNTMSYNRNNGYYYRNVDGQKVTFYVHKNNTSKTCYYYARIVSLGEYQAEGTIIQGTRVSDSINVSDSFQVTISQ